MTRSWVPTLKPIVSGSPIHASISPTALARIACALEMWVGDGARHVDLPWVAPDQFVQASRPSDSFGQDVSTPHGQLLTSGEQSFCWLASQGLLDDGGPFVGWTPCFRDEERFDATHHYGFMKAEAFAWADDTSLVLQVRGFASRALGVMRLLAGVGTPIHMKPLEDGTVDLELGGVEVGSIGARRLPGCESGRTYLYATVMAEPRFSQALALARPS